MRAQSSDGSIRVFAWQHELASVGKQEQKRVLESKSKNAQVGDFTCWDLSRMLKRMLKDGRINAWLDMMVVIVAS